MRNNAEALARLVGAQRAAFVLKSNAYGHGIAKTGLALEPFARYLCVYCVEEAAALRDAGVRGPILVLGPVPPDSLDAALAADAEIALWDTRSFFRDAAAAARKRSTTLRVHVKVNTGLNRFGLEPADVVDAIEDYLRVPEVRIAGIFSHLSSAEEIDSPYTMEQLARFERAVAQSEPVMKRRAAEPLRHIAASAAAMLWPQTRLDLCRFGIALYGLWPSAATREAMGKEALALEPALSMHSSLVVTRTIAAGEPVGYGNTFVAQAPTAIGVVPLGYADGIPRALGNRGAFLVEGVRCPIVGRVAMNTTTLDVSAAAAARAGSAVTLIGKQEEERVGADDWAQWAQTIAYEIVARLPESLPRKYLGD